MMKTPRCLGLIFCSSVLIIKPAANAQADPVRVAVANLTQDVNAIAQQYKALALDLEQVRRENAQLRQQLASDRAGREIQQQLSSALEALRREYRVADAQQKNQIIAEVSRQIDALGQQTEQAIRSVANTVNTQAEVNAAVSFSNDYPQSGITYTVRSGDTLSGIARKHASTTKYIQHANEIVNPARDLKVGQIIFIPIQE